MSSATEAGTDAETKRATETETGAESEWSPGTCSRCHCSHEHVLSVGEHGPICSDCFNVLLEDGDRSVVELIEDG